MHMPTEKGDFSSLAPEYLRLLHGKVSPNGLNAASQPRGISDKDLARAILSVLCVGGSSLIGAPPTDPPLFPVLDLMTDGSPTYFNASPRIDDVDFGAPSDGTLSIADVEFGAPFDGTLSAANVDFGAPFDDTLSSIINFDNLGLRLAPVDSLSATRIFASESACGRLIRRTFAIQELPSLIEAILSSKDEDEMIRRLHVDNAQVLIDAIDETLHIPELSPCTQKKCLKLLYRTCGRHSLLPSALKVPVDYDRSSEPMYHGGFGDVWKGKLYGQDVAIKTIRTYSKNGLQKVVNKFCKEVVMWKFLHHPNILPLIGVTILGTRLVMVSDWMENGNINEFTKVHPDADRLGLLTDVAEGLIYIHSKEMVHGDLKGANILIDEAGRARLADFGLLKIISSPANLLSSTPTAERGTLRWLSPELIAPQQFGLKKSHMTKSSDCYAFGMVMYEVISGKPPFHKDPHYTIPFKVVNGDRPPRGAKFTGNLWKMLESCWAPQPNDRPDISDVLQFLKMASNASDPPSPGSRGETKTDSDSRDSSDDSSTDGMKTHNTYGAGEAKMRGLNVPTTLPTPAGTGTVSKRGREEGNNDYTTRTKRPKVGAA